MVYPPSLYVWRPITPPPFLASLSNLFILCNPVSSIYIWSEIFRSPSEAKYGGHGGPELIGFSTSTPSFIVTCYVKTAQGTETDVTQGLHYRHIWLHLYISFKILISTLHSLVVPEIFWVMWYSNEISWKIVCISEIIERNHLKHCTLLLFLGLNVKISFKYVYTHYFPACYDVV